MWGGPRGTPPEKNAADGDALGENCLEPPTAEVPALMRVRALLREGRRRDLTRCGLRDGDSGDDVKPPPPPTPPPRTGRALSLSLPESSHRLPPSLAGTASSPSPPAAPMCSDAPA
jgi:hypothetical protein